MKKLILVLGSIGMVTVLSGCPIWIETEPVDPPDCDWGCSVECYDDFDCGDGYSCNVNGICVPDPVGPTLCYEDIDCLNGYCDVPEGAVTGTCVDTGTCETAEDCAVFGPGLTCDDRGICVLDEGPCPDGQCGCLDDSECADGQLCIESLCTDMATVCVFDFECGEGTCIDNACHATCVDNGVCPIGQGCAGSYCSDLEVGIDGCVYDEECGEVGFKCINATCHPTCTDGEECGEGEACTAGVCRADTAPAHECTAEGAECAEGMSCIRGKCRMPCAAPVNCSNQGAMSECFDGFCHEVAEIDSNCVRFDDCGEGASCINGQCLSGDF